MLSRIASIKPSPNLGNYLVLLILILWGAFRLSVYGDLSLSIAGNDTITFVEGSQVPLFSADMMTGRRLLTTNLIYKIFEPNSGYEILVNGSLETSRRVFQEGFDGIVILQTILSILGWSALTGVVSANMQSLAAKLMTALLIPAFGYTPQIADWDSILMSESLTFSMFVLQLALLIHIVFVLYKNPEAKVTPWMIAWGIAYFFWANLRDTNNYAALVMIGLAGLTLFFPRFRKHKALIGVIGFSLVLFMVGLVTFQQSGRSLISTINIYIGDIFPHPARVDFMQTELGMPTPETPEFHTWFEEHGVTGATRFIFAHPGYALEKLIRDFPNAFKQGTQSYFVMPEIKVLRTRLIALGESLHTETSTPFLIGIVLLSGILFAGFTNHTNTSQPWAWIGLYLFLTASIAIVPTILGDTWALHRHTIFSIAMYRLGMWVFALILMDIALTKNVTQNV
ncbi:MAG: hypothetical protein J0M11_14925 [Anaerolineae bacterium]|nr:hypothetical protein [Anaerolineae bacterium]